MLELGRPSYVRIKFVSFLHRLDAPYPAGTLICVLLDNHSAHRSREIRRFLESKPGRFDLVFTPTHASWLNWVAVRAAPDPSRQ